MPDLSKNSVLYMPDNNDPIGVVQIIHGMSEHQGRYRNFAQYLATNRLAVITSDLRGHGNNVNRTAELGYFGDNAVSRLVGDVHENTLYAKEQFPGLPYVIIAHSMGTLIATTYLKKYDNFLDGLILMGMPAYRSGCTIGFWIIKLLTILKGDYYRSKFADSLINRGYARAFSREGSNFAWLSANEDNVRRYEKDPKCGFVFTLNGYATLLELMQQTYLKGSWIRKNPKLPIRILSGEDDPCRINKSAFMKSVHLFSDNGYSNVAFLLYPGQRHEILQDTKKEVVYRDILSELFAICKKIPCSPKAAMEQSSHIVLEDFIDPEVDKPFVKEEELDLEEFINKHNDKKPSVRKPSVEVVDFKDIKEPENVDITKISKIFNSTIDEDIAVELESSEPDTDENINPEDFIEY